MPRRRRARALAATVAGTAVLVIGSIGLAMNSNGGDGDGSERDGGEQHRSAASPGTGQGEDPAAPLTARTRPYAYDDGCVQSFLVNRSADEVPERPVPQDAPSWAADLGAVPADSQYVEVTVQGTGRDTVVLQGMNVRVQSTGAPLAWNNFRMGSGCGGNGNTKSFAVDLDESAPRTRPEAGRGDFPYKVDESDPEVFRVRAGTRSHDVRWYLELEWSSGARHGVLRIDDQGKPFRTSGGTDRPVYRWAGPSKWVREQREQRQD
ncbi:hypothetical protein [Streptomyces silvensis]|uniref:hypothetical protein n=1 Tax=Streptomyces silvensis TaxID=1765722 RepID=UPI001F51CB94|nr:hypothetical protein [Streptomyces silvensis]